MKKLILSTLIFSVMFSCKKNDSADQIQETSSTENTDSTTQLKPMGTNIATMKVLDQEQLANLVSSKNNDTIYVTNFFATWCPPCMREIPDFVDKMKELKGKPVKFTFVSVDAKDDWSTKVSDFADEYDLKKNIVLFDASTISPDYFTKITKTWDGGSIPFTVIKKGDKEVENVGMMSKEELNKKIESFF